MIVSVTEFFVQYYRDIVFDQREALRKKDESIYHIFAGQSNEFNGQSLSLSLLRNSPSDYCELHAIFSNAFVFASSALKFMSMIAQTSGDLFERERRVHN